MWIWRKPNEQNKPMEGVHKKEQKMMSGWWPCNLRYALLCPVSVHNIAGRGCATTDKKYHVHCEAHEVEAMGATVSERVCYCSFSYCNTADGMLPQASILLLITGLNMVNSWHIMWCYTIVDFPLFSFFNKICRNQFWIQSNYISKINHKLLLLFDMYYKDILSG